MSPSACEPALDQPGPARHAPASGSGWPASPCGRAAGRRGRRRRAPRTRRGRRAGAAGGCAPAPSQRTGSVRGRTSTCWLPDGADRLGARQLEGIADGECRRRQAVQSAAGKARADPDAGGAVTLDRRQLARELEPRSGEGIDHLGAGQPQRAAAHLDGRVHRLVLDHPLGGEMALGGGAPGGQPQPRRRAGARVAISPTAGTNSGAASKMNDTRHSTTPQSGHGGGSLGEQPRCAHGLHGVL